MAKINNMQIPVAVNERHKLDLSYDHITTGDFMRLQPIGYRHMVNGERYDCRLLQTVRPYPMSVPTYGRMRITARAFFCPYRLVMPQWSHFYNDSVAVNYQNSGLVSAPPQFEESSLVTLFTDSLKNLTTITPGDVLGTGDIDLDGHPRDFTPLGRYFYSVLLSLGYELFDPNKKLFPFNALALLAYGKIYCDWYANSQYLNSADYISIQKLLTYNDPLTPLVLTAQNIFDIINFCRRISYDQDAYLNYAWDNPVAPNNAQFSNIAFADPSFSSQIQIRTNGSGTPYMEQMSSAQQNIGTAVSHEFLQRIQSYLRRHQIAGARSIDRVLAQYGVVSDYLKMDRSIYVGNLINDVDVKSVFATAAGSNNSGDESSVGDYSGAGFGQKVSDWSFTSDEEGVFMVLFSIVPSGGTYQGYDRINRRIQKLDFYTPEFDSQIQSIERGEVYVSRNLSFIVGATADYQTGFGFTGRYGEQKIARNFVTGDLRHFQGSNAWHLMREFNDARFGSIDGLGHSRAFALGLDADQYNRIFQYTKTEADHFVLHFHFDAAAYTPLKPLFETIGFPEVDRDGKKITTQINGTTLN